MKTQPLISVVLPVHNGSRYLARSIESCLRQTYHNWELVIIDDASADDTPAIITRFASQDPRVVAVRLDQNRRLPGALNLGFTRAKGDYLTWTSDDNLYEPDALEIMLRHLEAHPDTGLVYCDEQYIGTNGEDLGRYHKAGPEALADENCVGACFMYRRKVYDAVGAYDPSMVLVEDYDYWLRIARRFPIDHLRGIAPYKYRLHPESLSATRQTEVRIQIVRARCRHVDPTPSRRKALLDVYWSALWKFRLAGDLTAAWFCARRCFALAPWRLAYIRAAIGTGIRLLASARRPANRASKPKVQFTRFPEGSPGS